MTLQFKLDEQERGTSTITEKKRNKKVYLLQLLVE